MIRFLACMALLVLVSGMLPAQIKVGDLVMSDMGSNKNVTYLDRTTGTLKTLGTFAPGTPHWVAMAMNNLDILTFTSWATPSVWMLKPSGIPMLSATYTGGVPTGADLNETGDWLFSADDNMVRKMAMMGKAISVYTPTTPATPTNICRNHDTGNFILGISGAGTLLEIDDGGTIVNTVASGLGMITCLEPEPATGNIVVGTATAPHVRIITPTGTTATSWSFAPINGCKVDDSTGNIYAAGGDTVIEYSSTGTALNTWGPFTGYSFSSVEKYASRNVHSMGMMKPKPGSMFMVKFSFPDMPNESYHAALAFSQRPGFLVGTGGKLNLALDGLFFASMSGLFVSNFSGTLSSTGTAQGQVMIPSFLPKGVTFFCAGVAYNGLSGKIVPGNTIGITVR